MRKNYFFACAAAALMLASCQKEAPVSDASSKQEGTTPDAPTADMSVITATTSNTKVTTLDGVNVLWDKGDKIQLYTRTWKIKEGETVEKFHAEWCDYYSSIETPSATATFVRDEANTNTVDNTSGKYLAIYTKGATVVTQSRDYYAQIAINKEQVAKNGGDFVSTLLYAASEGADFTFSHAVSYLKFTVDKGKDVFIITVENDKAPVTPGGSCTYAEPTESQTPEPETAAEPEHVSESEPVSEPEPECTENIIHTAQVPYTGAGGCSFFVIIIALVVALALVLLVNRKTNRKIIF